MSTSRDDGSGILLYRIPTGTLLNTNPAPGIDTIQSHHRYMVVWPSTHPKTGNPYLWYDPSGEQLDQPPNPDDIPQLPWKWIQALTIHGKTGGAENAATTTEVQQFLETHTANRNPAGLDGIRNKLEQHHGSRHDTLITVACWAMNEAAAGWYPAQTAAETLHQWWLNVMDNPERRNNQEFGEAIMWAIGQVTQETAATKAEQINPNTLIDHTPNPQPEPDDNTPEGGWDQTLLEMLLDWDDFAEGNHKGEDWLWKPVIATGRGTAIFAKGGTGKSFIILRMVLDMIQQGHTVLYMDYEMTPDDLDMRLLEMDADLTQLKGRLHYALLPPINPLDSKEGGAQIRRLAQLTNVNLVVIDTYSRAVEGDENDANTTREFYSHTGRLLKKDGRALVRIDHAGKDTTKGQRGSSAKNDDVDVVWELIKGDNGLLLKNRKTRMSWVPQQVNFRTEEDPFRMYVTNNETYVEGTGELANQIDALGLPDDASVRKVKEALRVAGISAKNDKIESAVRYRKGDRSELKRLVDDPKSVPHSQGDAQNENGGGHNTPPKGDTHKTPGHSAGDAAGDAGGHLSRCEGDSGPPPREGHGTPSPTTDPDEDNLF